MRRFTNYKFLSTCTSISTASVLSFPSSSGSLSTRLFSSTIPRFTNSLPILSNPLHTPSSFSTCNLSTMSTSAFISSSPPPISTSTSSSFRNVTMISLTGNKPTPSHTYFLHHASPSSYSSMSSTFIPTYLPRKLTYKKSTPTRTRATTTTTRSSSSSSPSSPSPSFLSHHHRPSIHSHLEFHHRILHHQHHHHIINNNNNNNRAPLSQLRTTSLSLNLQDDKTSSPITDISPDTSPSDSDILPSPLPIVPELNLVARVNTAVLSRPHPQKAKTGGEDAVFVLEDPSYMSGVFDGVGGWANSGVNPADYSRKLARLTETYALKYGPTDIKRALIRAAHENDQRGSCTATVVGIDRHMLYGTNLGDSAIVIIRDSKVIHRSAEQQHFFNCPYQLGNESQDSVEEMAENIEIELKVGDIIILATDGLYDNVFLKDMINVIDKYKEITPDLEDLNLRLIAGEMGALAFKNAMNEQYESPFAVNARKAGYEFKGGKLDDITIVCSCYLGTEEKAKLN